MARTDCYSSDARVFEMTVAMILAAGRGERMRPLTDTSPKPLLRIKQKALIEYHLETLKLAGIEHVVINHAWLGQQIVDFLGSGNRYGLKLHYSAEQQALETAGGILQAMPTIKAHSDGQVFWVVNGDVFTNFDFTQLPTDLTQGCAHLVMVDNPAHHPHGDFACVEGRVTLQSPRLTFSGIAAYHFEFFKHCQPGKRALAPMLIEAIQEGRISGQIHSGIWYDIGTPERLAWLNQQESY